jgi:hypothetical protein
MPPPAAEAHGPAAPDDFRAAHEHVVDELACFSIPALDGARGVEHEVGK